MKIEHKTHGFIPDRTDPAWADRVEREAEHHTARTEAAWHKAQRRLARAIEKAETANARPEVGRVRKDRLWAIVEQRREELRVVERLARATPAGSQHRGKGSYRGMTTGEPW